MYEITDYTKAKARLLGVDVAPSKNKKKKIDVIKGGSKIASVGAIGYADYPTYIKLKGRAFADERKKLYKIRHAKDRSVIGSQGWWADQLLW